ncbi:hypothetical protein [Amycolatopsis pithecellobii]|uniref:Uncharacterized protein n=1 Tax=Amycolatopsis pithecellobii TaxID=664692 RepID=A0A6N7YZ35_9PSEU|nr:hypothetical protein [Amycolatopsis pithecellobii]MTD57152.1 hypothetical protein [Amycolatopsis pithecellobii]
MLATWLLNVPRAFLVVLPAFLTLGALEMRALLVHNAVEGRKPHNETESDPAATSATV